MLEEVTFAIPTYNRNEYLQKLLSSIPVGLGASFVVSDNGNFVKEETIEKHKAKTHIVSSDIVIPMYDNWNLAIGLVKTKWFFIPSDDDLYYPNKFDTVIDALEKYSDADIIIFGHHVIDENDIILSSWVPTKNEICDSPYGFEYFKYGVNARFPAILFRTEFVRKMGGIDSTYSFTAGDSLLIQKCLINGRSVFLNHIVGAYRTWPNNFTNQLISSRSWLEKIDRWQDEIASELKKNGLIKFDKPLLKDEVYAQNLLGGIKNLNMSKKNISLKIKFLLDNRYPWNAKFKTHCKILRSIFIG